MEVGLSVRTSKALAQPKQMPSNCVVNGLLTTVCLTPRSQCYHPLSYRGGAWVQNNKRGEPLIDYSPAPDGAFRTLGLPISILPMEWQVREFG